MRAPSVEACWQTSAHPSRTRSFTIKTALVMLGAWHLFSVPARAHDAFEIWTIAVLRPDQLELGVTMALATAVRLINPDDKARPIEGDLMGSLGPRLEREGAALCIFTSNGKPLAPRSVQVELTEENDIAFKIVYPRPAPGRLHLHSACLKKLGQGFGGIFEASDTAGNHLGWEQLSFENPNFEITIPAPSPPKK